MTRRYTLLAWTAAACTYLLIVLGAVVRITGSGMGCGDHWPLCNGRLFPPLSDIGTVIEWSHRLVAALVSALVVGLAAYAWWLRRLDRPDRPGGLAFVALALLILQVGLGAVTVKLELPPWSVILHLGTAMLLLATLLIAANPHPLPPSPGSGQIGAQHAAPLHLPLLALAFVTILLGALTANLGAAAACTGFPFCNGQIWPTDGALVQIHWMHRLLAYTLTIAVLVWAVRRPGWWSRAVLGLVVLQLGVGAATVLSGLPGALQAAHVAVGAAVWAGVVLAVLPPPAPTTNDERPAGSPPGASRIGRVSR